MSQRTEEESLPWLPPAEVGRGRESGVCGFAGVILLPPARHFVESPIRNRPPSGDPSSSDVASPTPGDWVSSVRISDF